MIRSTLAKVEYSFTSEQPMLDIQSTQASPARVQVQYNNKTLWVNVNGVCVLRISRLEEAPKVESV